MTKQESIKYISSIIIDPASITDGDQSSIALFRQKYPYFIPTRYLLALESHKKAGWNTQMRASIQPYGGNWMLFCSFLKAGSGEGEPMTYRQNEPTAIEEQIIFIPDQSLPEAPEVTERQSDRIESQFVDNLAVTEPGSSTTIEGDIIFTEIVTVAEAVEKDEESLIVPLLSQDYFLQQGVRVSDDLPPNTDEPRSERTVSDDDKSLMVMMSFSEWLLHFKNVSQEQNEELKERKALRTMWQKEKLAAAMEEENEEIPEDVFEMAVNSISSEDGLVSETLADIYIKQEKYDKAVEVYRKLSLRNPQKSVYFARKIEEILKDKQS